MKTERVAATLLLVALVACTTEPRRATLATPSPDASSAPSARCRAFPDRVIDRFVEAYNARDLDALTRVVTAGEVEDVVAGAYSGDSSFDGVEDWARAAWAAADRIRSAGYSFQPSSRRFEMLVTRTSNRLSQAGIERVSMTLQADTEECAIAALTSEGPVQAATDPCAFYDAFRAAADVAATEPRSCADGSAAFARSGAGAVAVGGSALVWGGDRGGYLSAGDVAMDGLLLEAGSRRATRVRPPDVRPFRPEVVAWTGSELLVVGTTTKRDDVVAAAYSPATRTWRRVAFPFGRPGGFEGVWTGRELLLWGGPSHSVDPSRRGLAYDPLARAWRRTAPAPHGGRWSHAVVWTGTEMIVFGGTDSGTDLAEGLAYDPATDTWRELAPSPLSPRQWLPLVWTGTEVVAWGGSSISRPVADGAAYDPVADTWRKLRKSPLRGRHRHSAVWTGSEVVVFGGYDYHRSFANAAAYDPVANRWRRLPRAPLKPRHDHAAVWTGGQMLVFGGTWEFGHFSLGDGAWYDPARNRWRRVVPRLGSGTPSQS